MRVIKLVNNATAASATAPQTTDEGVTLISDIEAHEGRDEFLVQVDFTGTGTARVYGKLGSGRQWAQLGSDIVASGIYAFARVPKVIAQIVTLSDGGSVTVLAGL
jgi:hypothetical protein